MMIVFLISLLDNWRWQIKGQTKTLCGYPKY